MREGIVGEDEKAEYWGFRRGGDDDGKIQRMLKK